MKITDIIRVGVLAVFGFVVATFLGLVARYLWLAV